MANVARARKAFKDFTGHAPTQVSRSALDGKNVAGWKMGPVVGVAYEAKRDGQVARYFHEFKKSARPDLVARDDGRQLYFSGGRYKVTDRGIEDMPALFVVNPSPRAGAKRSKPVAKRSARRKSTRRRAPTTIVLRNPVKRRRSRRVAASSGRSRRTYRRNPILGRRRGRGRGAISGALNFGKMFLPAAAIGAGALGAELIMGYLPIPANFKIGPLRQVTKGVIAVAAGTLISKVLKQPKIGNAVALGGVVIAVHDLIKEIAVQRMPGVQFGGMGYYNPASTVNMSEYLPRLPGMGEYISTRPGGFHGMASDGYAPATPSFGV